MRSNDVAELGAHENADFDVAIVGAGPVGTTLALLLDRLEVSTVLLERDRTVTASPRAVGVDDMGLRTWQSCGVIGRLLPDMMAVGSGEVAMVFHTQNRRRLARWCPDTRRFGFSRGATLIQPLVERHLRDALHERSHIELRTGHEARSVDADRGGVRVRGRRDDAGEFSARARFVVGCDGGDSRVRAALGAGLEGSYRSERWLIADVVEPTERERDSHDILVLGETPRAVVTVPRKHGHRRWEFQLLAGESDEEMLRDDSIARLIRRFGGDPCCRVLRRIVYRFRAGNASTYGVGPVLIAGDAAHVMPPYAGQGLSCGLHDVANLAWRLWLATRHGASLRLLEDYDRERRSVNRRAIRLSVFNRILVAPDTRARRRVRDAVIAVVNALPGGRRRLSQMQIRPFSRYSEGTIARDFDARSRVGQILPQWESRAAGEPRALDELLGPGFSLLAFGEVDRSACGTRALAFWRTLGREMIEIPDSDLESMSAEIRRFATPLLGHIVVVRPDRIVMAICRADQLDPATRRCRQLLTVG